MYTPSPDEKPMTGPITMPTPTYHPSAAHMALAEKYKHITLLEREKLVAYAVTELDRLETAPLSADSTLENSSPEMQTLLADRRAKIENAVQSLLALTEGVSLPLSVSVSKQYAARIGALLKVRERALGLAQMGTS